uniref:Variant surface glycoprotein 602 n=1 Tax=Trypanosoma brucei TaxID=5691 RepID=M4TDL9_9TRYP|nr:variant surface glycoprotein 602 [Trypanosoma brucei]
MNSSYELKTSVILLIASITAAEATETTGDAEHTKVTTLCLEAAFAKAAAQKYSVLALATAGHAKNLAALAAVWRTAAAKEPDAGKSSVFTAAAKLAAAKALTALDKHNKRASDMLAAAKLLERRHGYLLGIQAMLLPTLSKQATPFKPNGRTNVIMKLGAATTVQQTCNKETQKAGADEIKATAEGNQAWKKLMYAKDADITKLFPTITAGLTFASGTCAGSSSPVSGYYPAMTSCHTTLSGMTKATFTPGTATLTQQQPLYSDESKKTCAATTISDDESRRPKEELIKSLCGAQAAAAAKVDSVADLTLDAISSDQAVITAVRNGAPQFKNVKDSSESTAEETIKKYIQQVLGGNQQKFEELFVTKLQNDELSYRGDKNTAKENLKTLAQKKENGAAITYFLDKKTPKPQPETAKTITAAEKCKEETDETKCKEDKDCEHKDGKCKLKEGVKSENDAKTTKATGSNSFVINKTPLWLAFLFLA